ncbi:MAG: hypothetical protein J6E46_04385 [Faecalicoccus sp.]|nr:hypothetical protein [Faecalicoccus sp.]
MEIIRNFPLFTIVLSLFSGALCFLLDGQKARRYTLTYEVILIGLTACIFAYTLSSGTSFTYTMGEFPAPWGNEIRAGVLEGLFACVFMVIMFCSMLAGKRFVKTDIDASKINLYYSLINLMTAAIMSLVWTNDIFTGYVFLEILTLTSCGSLIVREIGRTSLAAMRYMIMNLVGSGLYLMGIILLYDITGHLLMVPMHETIQTLWADPSSATILTLALGILTIGLSIKSGLFPFHFWMPDTYGWATPASGSVLSSLVSKVYIFLLVKIYFRVVGLGILNQTPIPNILLVLGMCGIVFGSVEALRADNINRMVAFSSAAQIGYIYMGIGLGTEAGFLAAFFHILAHSVTKSLLFLTTPRLADVSGSSLKFSALTGSAKRNPVAGFFFLMGALSMIGIPIFAGFASKIQFGIAAVDSSSTLKMVLVMIVLAISSALNAFYFLRTVLRIYSVTQHSQADEKVYVSGLDYTIPMVVLTAANLGLGLVSPVVLNLITTGMRMFA